MTNSSLRKKRRCPYCGEEADTIFMREIRDHFGMMEAVGCDSCIVPCKAGSEELDDEYDDGEGETYYGNHTGEF